MSTVPVRTYSVEEYLALERQSETRHDYCRGEMLPIPEESKAHAEIVHNLEFRTRSLLFDANVLCADVFAGNLRIRCPDSFYTYPDIVLVCGNVVLEDAHQDTLLNPVVIMEVLSPETEAEDRGRNWHSYREIESLREYVLVSQDCMSVDHFVRHNSGKEWMVYFPRRAEEELSISNGQGRLKLSEIYENVEFAPANADSQPAN